jgi:hypothetical protein
MIHFIGSSCGQAGKSWFIRALVEIVAKLDDRLIVVDTSSDKKIGMVYSPIFNGAFDIQFSSPNSLLLDPILDWSVENMLIVKIPAHTNENFIEWLREMEIPNSDIPAYYWFVSRGNDDYPSEILDLFGENCFLVENHYFWGNFEFFVQPEFEDSRRIKLSGIIKNPPEIERIESSRATLSYLQQTSTVTNASRIYRFLKSIEEPLSSIIIEGRRGKAGRYTALSAVMRYTFFEGRGQRAEGRS